MEDILIKGARVIDPAEGVDEPLDVLIKNGIIAELYRPVQREEKAFEEPCGTKVIEAAGLCMAPGLIDVHVHFRDPGFTYKEDIHSGAMAAAKGGFTSVVMMANTRPSVDSADILKDVLDRADKEGINIYSAANMTKGMAGKEKTDLSALKRAGAVCISDDGKPVLDGELLMEAMKEAAELKLPVSLHEEDPAFIKNNGINEGETARFLGIGGSDRQAEISMVKRDIELALKTGACLDIQHISTKEAVELVRDGRKRGGDIHAEATPHHFTLTEKAVLEFGANAKMNPPLRTEEDRLAVIEGLKDGTIDIIATDHAPHSMEEKGLAISEDGRFDAESFLKAPSGITGLETALSLGITELVEKGHLGLSKLIELMSPSPAKIYGLPAGTLKKGARADLILFDPAEEWVFMKGEEVSKSENSPFYGRRLKGRVRMTFCGGEIVYSF